MRNYEDREMDIEKWKQKAINEIKTVPISHIFILKDLFDGIEWSTLPKGDKLSFGKVFKNEVMDGRIPGVVYIGKASNNSAQYKRVEE